MVIVVMGMVLAVVARGGGVEEEVKSKKNKKRKLGNGPRKEQESDARKYHVSHTIVNKDTASARRQYEQQ